MNNIYLVGFMGTGKTSVGKIVSRKKKWQFVDLDELIEFRERRTIAEIFAKEGEAYFRRVEKLVLKEVSVQNNFVAACGGGIIINEENITLMKNSGVMICLTASVDIILKRTSHFGHRPLLNTEEPRAGIEKLLKGRARFYALADYTIDTSNFSVEEVAEKVLAITSLNS